MRGADLDGDDIGAPPLCTYHRAVANQAVRLEHLDDRHVQHNLTTIGKQCPDCGRNP